MPIEILSVAIERHDISTRMPFKYGIATMTHLPHLFIRATVRFDSQTQMGIAADHLPPKWFTKDPDKDPLEEIDDMLRVIEAASEHAQQIQAETVFSFWHQLYKQQHTWSQSNSIPPLLAHFGTSLIERALIDAFCRFRQSSFAILLHENAFGIELGILQPELAGKAPKDLLPPPLETITIRHTVGLADPLTESEISDDERISDGLPQSLEKCIQFYGVTHFKIKVNGVFDQDSERLHAIEKLFNRIGLSDFAFTLDGNEQFKDVASFQKFWNSLQSSPHMKAFFEHLIFVEQPFHRDWALSEEIGTALKSWNPAPPIIIDESDATLESAFEAMELGYQGTSHKNCKGVFKGILNRALINHRNENAGEKRFQMSGEDLANIGPIANHMDLVVQACLGNASVERNGHHYFKGLSVFESSIQENVLRSFPSLYAKEDDYVRLNITNGTLNVRELLETPFGTDASHFR